VTPFSSLLNSIRIRHGIRQFELADLMGYEQTYISALEVGKKGPPTPEFIDKLIAALNLSSEESEQLRDAADASQRKFVFDANVPLDVYWLMRDLRKCLPELNSAQIDLIRLALDLKERFKERPSVVTHKLKRRTNETKVEAHM
jgi:transcriptional regulator with XRE-family HTH domain